MLCVGAHGQRRSGVASEGSGKPCNTCLRPGSVAKTAFPRTAWEREVLGFGARYAPRERFTNKRISRRLRHHLQLQQTAILLLLQVFTPFFDIDMIPRQPFVYGPRSL